MDVIKAERQTVLFVEGITVDGYRMPNGEFRVGITSASTVLGYSKEWLSRVASERPKTLKALQGLGFTGCQLAVRITRENKSGASSAYTINLSDFNCLLAYAASQGKKPALAMQLALTGVALVDFFRDAFSEMPLTTEEKRNIFYQTYSSTFSKEDWLSMDREDIKNLSLPGDEQSLL